MENYNIDKEPKFNIFLSLRDFYSVEDFCLFEMTSLHKILNKEKLNNEDYIRVIFEHNLQEKEIIIKKSTVKKVYSLVKINYKDTYMGILTYNNKSFDPIEILNKINSIKKIRSFIMCKLNIREFPLTNFYLQEIHEINSDFDKTFCLVEKNNILNNINNQNMFNNITNTRAVSNFINNNNINNNNFPDENQELRNKLNTFKLENEKLKNEINRLTNENYKLNMELNKANKIISNINNMQQYNQGNNNIINDLKQVIKGKDKEINDLKLKLKNSDKNKLVNYDDLLYVHFMSMDQVINCPIKCLKTDTFAEVEEKLYKKYGEFRKTNNNFLAKGKIILRFKTIDENNIEDGDKIQLIKIQ